MTTTTKPAAPAQEMPIADRLEHCAKFTGLDAVRELLIEAAQAVRKRDAVIRQAAEALENASPAAWASRVDSDTMKSIWRKHVEALEGLQELLAELDNTACKSVQKRLAIQQAEARTDVRCEGCGYMTHHREHMGCVRAAKQFTHPAPGEPVYQICKKDSQSISTAWIDVEKQAYEDASVYPEYGRRTLYTHPAPSVPDDWNYEISCALEGFRQRADEAFDRFVSEELADYEYDGTVRPNQTAKRAANRKG